MGHVRMGVLPRSRKWRQVVDQLRLGADTESVADGAHIRKPAAIDLAVIGQQSGDIRDRHGFIVGAVIPRQDGAAKSPERGMLQDVAHGVARGKLPIRAGARRLRNRAYLPAVQSHVALPGICVRERGEQRQGDAGASPTEAVRLSSAVGMCVAPLHFLNTSLAIATAATALGQPE